MHDATAPVLYSEIVVNNSAGLLKGIDSDHAGLQHMFRDIASLPLSDSPLPQAEDSTSAARIHKRDLLAKVTAIHYIYGPADLHPLAGYLRDGTCLTDSRAHDSAQSVAEIFRHCDFERYIGATRALGDRPVESLFPRLKRRITSLWGIHLWPWSLAVAYSPSFVAQLAEQMNVPYAPSICGQAAPGDSGPFGHQILSEPSFSDIVRSARRVRVNFVHDVPLRPWFRGDTSPHPRQTFLEGYLIVGAHNYLGVKDLDLVWSRRGVYCEESGRALLDTVRIATTSWDTCVDQKIMEDTRITFILPRLSALRPAMSTGQDEEFMTELQRHLKEATEDAQIKEANRKWARRIEFVWTDSVPRCPVCGRSQDSPAGA